MLYAIHASTKGVNCSARGIAIACASSMRARVALLVRVILRVCASSTASESTDASTSSVLVRVYVKAVVRFHR